MKTIYYYLALSRLNPDLVSNIQSKMYQIDSQELFLELEKLKPVGTWEEAYALASMFESLWLVKQ